MSRRKIIVILILIALGLLVIWFASTMLRSGWIEISAPATTQNNTPVTVGMFREGQVDPTSFELKPGERKKLFLRTGTMRIDGAAGTIKSIDIVSIKRFSTVKITTPHGEQRANHKLGSDATSCPFKAASGAAFSYNCHGDGPVYRHEKLNSLVLDSRTPLFDNAQFFVLRPIQNGLLGFLSTDEQIDYSGLLRYLDPTNNTQQTVPLPDTVKQLLATERPDILTSDDINNPRFAFFFRTSNTIYFFKNIGDMDPALLQLPESAKSTGPLKLMTAQVIGDHVVVYSGKTDAGDEEEAEIEQAEKANYESFIHEFDQAGKLTDSLKLDEDFLATGVRKMTGGFYAVEENLGVSFYYRDGDSFKSVFQMPDATTPIVVGDKVYTVANHALFVFEPLENGLFNLQSLYSSEDIALAELFTSATGLLFTANSNRQTPSPLDMFELLDTKQTTPTVEESIARANLSDIIIGYDYDDQTALFVLASTGAPGTSYQALLDALRAELSRQQVDLGDRAVQLYPLN